MTKTYEQKALEVRIRDHVTYGLYGGGGEWQPIERVDVVGLAEDIIDWANTREKRHGRKK